MLSSVAYPAHFPNYPINGTIFEKVTEHKSVFWFSLKHLSENFLILKRTERDVKKTYIGLLVKYGLFL